MYQTTKCANYYGKVPYTCFMNSSVSCDECGKCAGEIRRTSDFINFCSDCHEHYVSLPVTMKHSLENWLMGNVL